MVLAHDGLLTYLLATLEASPMRPALRVKSDNSVAKALLLRTQVLLVFYIVNILFIL